MLKLIARKDLDNIFVGRYFQSTEIKFWFFPLFFVEKGILERSENLINWVLLCHAETMYVERAGWASKLRWPALRDWWSKIYFPCLSSIFVILTQLDCILVPRGRDPFGQHLKSRPLARSNDIPVLNGFVNTIDWDQNQSDLLDLTQSMRRVTGSPWIADFRSWTWPEVVIFRADHKDRGLWGREWARLLLI